MRSDDEPTLFGDLGNTFHTSQASRPSAWTMQLLKNSERRQSAMLVRLTHPLASKRQRGR